jgi:hypothetical protein
MLIPSVILLDSNDLALLYLGYECTGINYERKLVRKILDDYDTSVMPSRNASEPLNVTFGLALTQIIDVVSEIKMEPGLFPAHFY